VLAHHGFAGRYDEEHPFTGKELFWNSSSSILIRQLYFEAKDQSGAMPKWHAELGGANALHRADGWTKDTLKTKGTRSPSSVRATRTARMI